MKWFCVAVLVMFVTAGDVWGAALGAVCRPYKLRHV